MGGLLQGFRFVNPLGLGVFEVFASVLQAPAPTSPHLPTEQRGREGVPFASLPGGLLMLFS
jgi:hypothetical protein